ncbi:ribosomal protein S18-alanine N-acetyltransferase [Acinetobacter gerneri]|jgi:ribosomal-protein-alanine N-acetyltransferase|uniref:[Ribosomal protein bS18]-alanine N-acetyltransferase n=2 Tax=Acinetobacter gerneri TaxID=202952 RepID=N8ZPH3_9GAMM|nr:ribosomal protein S18-alanine N-acetyltransferase [Acinetobacter gerneri]ENV33643.1 ribosomal-protein-alanine acetyltransferase [Acinetobacter gerneri DSM 14967 = CIP 107464 = MTCC 9824]EPR82143.1 Ribosomal-protein-S18p-alanine acetyltransferase [Acinetobacter gerneri DSM 14967 = CIP 107464 = MTCC 9824]MCH4243291.1 ribosomal protein S18-alanine N-acetyltransferase [Acinetobacter gerneri]MDQ9008586.1 ribosomal protein S18-alanine N-acetyltransferase [Acinetobacter gerneri]MDQ9012866.1 riboso
MIRLMQKSDLSSVAQIEKLVQSHPWNIAQFEESLASYQCTVFEKSNQVVGFCILQTVLDEANLLLMAIHPNQQGQGLGYQLLDESIQMLKNNPIQIFLEVRESNTAAIALYEKSDFHQIDLRKNYYPNKDGSREHAIIMVKACSDDFSQLFK